MRDLLPKVTTGYQIFIKGQKIARKANKTVLIKNFGYHWLPLVKNLTIFYIILPLVTKRAKTKEKRTKKEK